MEFRVKKKGFTLYLGGTWYEISNRYGVVRHGDVEVPDGGITEKYAEKILENFIDRHSLKDTDDFDQFVVKKVAFDSESKEYIQLRAVRDDKYWTVQVYDNEFVYIKEVWSGCEYEDEMLDWMRTNFDIQSCLKADVYRDGLDDYTNGGISSTRHKLHVLSKKRGLFEPHELRECVYIERRKVMGEEYICCKPAYCRKRWYMAGGNFLYTPDSRFEGITGLKYPIPIHDRYEGNE